jgi:hypothetical protein
MNNTPTFTVATRSFSRVFSALTLADAIRAGMALKTPFDIHGDSGEVLWTWEMRA